MENNDRILAIVVTHNRLELLKRCIHHLNQQTVSPDILIIDNASSDGTKEFLVAEGIDHVTQANLGSAGGWERGITEGWDRGYRFIWMMDDDGFPDRQALEILLKKFDGKTICVSSVVVKENKPNELVFGMPKMNRNNFPVIFSLKRKYQTLDELSSENGMYPHAHLFNGALIDLQAAKTIGNIDRSYFMFGDEVDYYFRLRAKGKIYSAIDALHYHPDVSQRMIDKKKVYYFIRNTIILNHLYFDKAYLRDFFTVGVAMYRIFKRTGVRGLFSYFFGANRQYLYPAIADGYKKRKINRFT